MSDSLGDILKNKMSGEPPEIKDIKAYVKKKFNAEVGINIAPTAIAIIVDNSALAGMLRLDLHNLIKKCQIKKRVYIRTG